MGALSQREFLLDQSRTEGISSSNIGTVVSCGAFLQVFRVVPNTRGFRDVRSVIHEMGRRYSVSEMHCRILRCQMEGWRNHMGRSWCIAGLDGMGWIG